MKKYHLYLSLRVDVDSQLASLSETIQEFEHQTGDCFSDTPNIQVTGTELLKTEPFNLKNNDHGTQFEL